jgi:hypothetical protein
LKEEKERETGNQEPVNNNDTKPEARDIEEVVDELVASEELVEEPGQEPVASGRLELDQ